MAPLALNRVASRVSAPAASPRARVALGPRTVVFSQEPRFTLENSSKSAEGFVEKDTAGQSNMYPTVIKPFEAGSPADTVEQDTFNNGIAVGGSIIALSAIGLGLVALLKGGSGSAPAPEDAAYLSLSAYSANFAEQLATPQAPPAEVLAAPALAATAVEVTAVEAAPEAVVAVPEVVAAAPEVVVAGPEVVAITPLEEVAVAVVDEAVELEAAVVAAEPVVDAQ